MNRYLLRGTTESFGPFDVSELRARQITHETLVMAEGSDGWMKAGDVPALAELFVTPPSPELAEGAVVENGLYWGDSWANPNVFQRDACTGRGFRQFSAILWNIPWGQSWEETCAITPATVHGYYFPRPSRCKNAGGHMWGEFDVPDGSCGVIEPPPPPANRVPTCRLWAVNANALLQTDGRHNVELQVALKNRTIPHLHQCQGNVPDYTSASARIHAIVQADHIGDWKFFHPRGAIHYRGKKQVALIYDVIYGKPESTVQVHFRPNPYQTGRYVFRIWLNFNGDDVFFQDSPNFPVENGHIVKSVSITR